MGDDVVNRHDIAVVVRAVVRGAAVKGGSDYAAFLVLKRRSGASPESVHEVAMNSC